jgi:hypothetical protein
MRPSVRGVVAVVRNRVKFKGLTSKMPHKTKTARRQYQKNWRKQNVTAYSASQQRYVNSGKKRWAAWLRRFNITPDDYHAMEVAQGYVCAACGQPETRKRNGVLIKLAVDHDHETDIVRGLMCSNCNTALGLLKDSLIVIEMPHQYLRTRGSK